jgi:uncharacterized oligopeptide transporter (OPT) family protein
MPCLLVLIAVVFPRVCLVLTWLLSTVLQRAYHDMIVPIIGFIFLPLTTLVYAWMVSSHMPIEGFNLIFLVLAVLVDAGGHGGGANYYRSRRSY